MLHTLLSCVTVEVMRTSLAAKITLAMALAFQNVQVAPQATRVLPALWTLYPVVLVITAILVLLYALHA
jgi:hypothetical protein